MFVLTVILSLAASCAAETWIPRTSAASDAQIRFAVENKYDSTGPGAKSPEYAYKTYKTLEEALVAYADDPDTQLPTLEKQKALHKLTWSPNPTYNTIPDVTPVPRYQPKTVDEYTGYNYKLQQFRNQNPVTEYQSLRPQTIQQNVGKHYMGWIPSQRNIDYYTPQPVVGETYKPYNGYGFESLNTEQRIVSNSGSQKNEDFDPNPQYSFSYGVHDKGTGDSKSAHETRDGGTVRGYYTFMDADGKQRTVHYTADDKLGFRASVQRTPTNTQ